MDAALPSTIDAALRDRLRPVPFFSRLDESLLAKIAGRTRRRRFAARQMIFYAGDPGRTLYMVLEGTVTIQKQTATGQTLHLTHRGPGEHIGDLALIDGQPRMADAVTVTPCDLLMLDRDDFLECIETNPEIALSVMTSLAVRIREAADDLEGLRSRDVLGRLAQALLTLAAQSGEMLPAGAVRLSLGTRRQDLADQIGATRESVSRAMSHLRRLKAVQPEGRSHLIVEPDRLRRCCEQG